MATLSTTRKAYRGKYTPLGNCVGYESGLSTASVMRYKFTTDEKGATKVSFQTSNCNLGYFQEGDSSAYDTIAKIRFIITAQATGYETYHGSAGTKCQYDYGDWLKGEIEMDLLPNTDYYLWIFPNFGGFAVWGIGSCTVETEGVYGQPSTIAANDGYLGEDIPISITRGLDVMLHTVKVECAGLTKVLAEQSAQYPTFVWQPSIAEYAPLITKAAAADAVISVETFLNGNSLGISTKTIKVKIPETALLPQVSDGWVSAAPYNTGAASGFTVYIRTYSRAQITFDASKIDMSGTEGGSIADYEITCNGSTVKESPYLTPVLSAEASVVCAVIDSRGRRISKTIKITPLPYSTPSLTQISVERCDNTGALTEDGYYHKVSAAAVYSTLSGQNSITLRTAFRNLQGSFGSYSSLESGKAAVIYGTSPDASYEVRIEITDKLGNSSSATRRLPTRQWAMKFREDAQGLAFGKAPEFSNALELPEAWTIRRGLTDEVVWGDNGKVPRAKLATDALFSPTIVKGTGNLAASEVGGTIQNSWNTSATYTLTQTFSATLPLGTTFAFLRSGSWTASFSVIIKGSGIRLGIADDQYYTGSASLEVLGFCNIVALRKIASDANNGDLWVAYGNVEVVS